MWNQLKISILTRLSLHVHIVAILASRVCIDVLFDIYDTLIQYRFIKSSIQYFWIDHSYSRMYLSLHV